MTTPFLADFGPLLLSTDIDEAVLALLAKWLPTYLAQIERERGQSIGRFKRPVEASFSSTLEDAEFPDYMLPAVLATCANTDAEPDKDGSGIYSADWNVVISCVVRGRRPRETRWIAAIFEGCVRRILVHQALPWQHRTKWTGTHIGPVADPTGEGRYLAAGISTFVVSVDEVVQDGVGPMDVQDDPSVAYDPLAQVDRVIVDVDGLPPTGTIGGP